MRALGILFAFLLVAAAALFLIVVQPGPSGVVATLRLPDGSEYMVTQRCNWSVEPYTISFYMRSPGKPWGWCYIDHEADRWRDVELFWDRQNDTVVITKAGLRRAALNRTLGTFWLDFGSESREVTAPQSWHDPEFPFPKNEK